MRHLDGKSWDGLARAAFATGWDPEKAIDWDRPLARADVAEGWITILQFFHEGEWQGLEIIQRLMNRAAHLYEVDEMITYYSTQCYDESKHLFVFRRYLEKVGAAPAKARAFDALVLLATRGPLPVERWILGTYFTETLAAAIFRRALRVRAIDETCKEMIRLMLKDEARHIAGTRLAVETVLARSGALKAAALRLWWSAFIRLAVGEARKLTAPAAEAGLDAEAILTETFDAMALLPRFNRAFLGARRRRGP
jgi:ribonucleotide reductase beta subunit family protein with ferritin-like domain